MSAGSEASVDRELSTGEPLVRVRGLVLATGDSDRPRILVHGVDLDVHRGEVLCIVGESGSGKSLTVLAVMGLLPPGVWIEDGTIEFAGRDLAALSERELRPLRGKDIAMVFQDPLSSLNPLRRVGSQIGEAVRLHDRSLGRRGVRARVLELLESVGVADAARRARRFPNEWSGGMRQRAVIAMAIAHDPALIIADEPTTALDVTVQAQVMRVLAEVRRRTGSALILITHDLGLAAGVSDTMVIMRDGRAVERGTVFDVFDEPAHPYTRELLASVLTPVSVRGHAVGVSTAAKVAAPAPVVADVAALPSAAGEAYPPADTAARAQAADGAAAGSRASSSARTALPADGEPWPMRELSATHVVAEPARAAHGPGGER